MINSWKNTGTFSSRNSGKILVAGRNSGRIGWSNTDRASRNNRKMLVALMEIVGKYWEN